MDSSQLSPFDKECLIEAVHIGFKGDARVHPNPRVGAVIAKDGRIIGRGWHRQCGGDHAEVAAIKDAEMSIRGSTVYVSLEPCSHHGRTPPCAERLIKEGVSKVVYAMGDPGPGQGGAEILRKSGIEVIGPVESPAAKRLLAPFKTHTLEKRSHLTLKWAMTLDGRIALSSGDSKWVTSEEARAHVHLVRSQVDGIMVGAGTVLADQPALNVRHGVEGPDPKPIIWDPRGRLRESDSTPEWWRSMSEREALLVSDEPRAKDLRTIPWKGGENFRERLLEQGVHHVLVEGGSGLLGSMVDHGLGDDAMVYLAPKVCGGSSSLSPVGGKGAETMNLSQELQDLETFSMGQDFLLLGQFKG